MPGGNARAAAVGALYQDHRRWLLGWLRGRTGCGEKAADLLQDTFVRVLRAPEGALDALQPRAYLVTVAGRLLSNHFRRASLEQAWLATLRTLPEASIPGEEERRIVLETLQQVDAALDALPARARRSFLLSQLEGLTYAEIAARTGVHVRTIKRDMALAFLQLLQLQAAA